MRRLLTVTFGFGLLGLLSSAASADVIDFTPFAGYTSVNMDSVNKAQVAFGSYLQGALQEETTLNGPATYSSASYADTDLSSAWIVGGDLLTTALTPFKNLSLGLRGEYLATNAGGADLTAVPESGLSGGPISVDLDESGSLTGLLLGGRYQLPGASDGLKLSVGAFAGVGYGVMGQSFTVSQDGEDAARITALYEGEGFMGDVDLRLDWAVFKVQWLRLNAQAGYRYASLGEFSGHGQAMGTGPGVFFKDGGDPSGPVGVSSVDVDFSGLTAGGGLSVVF